MYKLRHIKVIRNRLARGGRSMRTLDEVRQLSRRKDLLLDGMEQTPVCLPQDLQDQEKELYNSFVKPSVEKFFLRHLKDGHI